MKIGILAVQGKLLRELDMFDTLKMQIEQGKPVLATCAGLILLAQELSNDSKRYFQTLPVTVRRNAYGRQLGSFYCEEEIISMITFYFYFEERSFENYLMSLQLRYLCDISSIDSNCSYNVSD